MRFWDSSALAPLLVTEPDSYRRELALDEESQVCIRPYQAGVLTHPALGHALGPIGFRPRGDGSLVQP